MRLPITKPYITEKEKEYVLKPLETGWLVQGPYVLELEQKFCEYTGAKYAIATSSCTTAQFIASRCIDIKEGDEVIVPSFTWISTANSVEIFGAKPVLVDIDLDTFNIDIEKIKMAITPNTKAIYPVNLFGLAANMNEIKNIAKEHHLKVIEDCACSLGGFINSKHTGTFGDCGCFSMHPRKSITTGEGGMIITDDPNINEMARSLRDHGAVRSDYDRHHNKKSFLLSDYALLGYNYRLTDIQAAIGVAQFEKLHEIMDKKHQLAQIYDTNLNKLDFLQAPYIPQDFKSGYQAYICIFEPEKTKSAILENDIAALLKLNEKRDTLMYNLEEKGISTRQGTHSIHTQKYYIDKYKFNPEDFINSFAAEKLSLALPFYPGIQEEEIEYLFSNLKEEYRKL